MDRKTRSKPDTGEATLDLLVRPARMHLRRAAALSVIAALLWPLQAALVALGIAGLLPGMTGPGPLAVAGGFVALGLLRAGIASLSEAILFDAATGVVRQIRAGIVAREAQRTTGPGGGAVAALAGEKLDLLAPYITRYAPARARVLLLPPLILALAFWFSWAAGLVLLITGPLIPLFMALVGMAAKEISQRQLAEIGTLNDLLVERLSSLVDIRLLDAGGAVTDDLAVRAENLRARTMAVLRVAFLSSTVLELFSAIGVAMVAVYVGFSLLGALSWGSYGMPLAPAAGIFLLLLAPDFYQPLRDLSSAWHDKAAASAVAQEYADWTKVESPELLGVGAQAQKLQGPAEIAIKGLCLAQPGGRSIRYPDFTLQAGGSLALTGPSGVGKTTLLRALAGLVKAKEGQITVAGTALDAESADGWRARLGWMPQSPHFLGASLWQNIALGRSGDLAGALALAQADELIPGLPHGLQTRLGETGNGLSGGEARRFTLARAVFAGPDVVLADEPTADLDAETASAVTDGLMALAKAGCTLIVATHDPAVAARMDRVIALESRS